MRGETSDKITSMKRSCTSRRCPCPNRCKATVSLSSTKRKHNGGRSRKENLRDVDSAQRRRAPVLVFIHRRVCGGLLLLLGPCSHVFLPLSPRPGRFALGHRLLLVLLVVAVGWFGGRKRGREVSAGRPFDHVDEPRLDDFDVPPLEVCEGC